MARTTWHMTYSGFPWASMTEQGRNFACCGFAAGAWCFGIRHTSCTAGNHGDVVWAPEIWVVVGDVDRIKLRIRVIGEVGELGLFIFVWSGIGQTTRLPPASGCVWGLTPTSCAARKWRWSPGWGSTGWREERRERSELDVEQRHQRLILRMHVRDDYEWRGHNFILSHGVRSVCSRDKVCCGTLQEVYSVYMNSQKEPDGTRTIASVNNFRNRHRSDIRYHLARTNP